MHPITVIEITVSVVFLIVIFVAALLLPSKFKKLGIISALSITAIILSFFAIRPYWVDFQAAKKTEQLQRYLEEKYPDEQWDISRQTGRQYNPYHINVTFNNENDWIYTYFVINENNICQRAWSSPEGKFPDEGKHFEGNQCE